MLVPVWAAGVAQLHWLPRSVTELRMEQPESSEAWLLDPRLRMPPALRSLMVEDDVPQPAAGWKLPATLTQLQVGWRWSELSDLALPDGLQTFIFSRSFKNSKAPLLPTLPSSLIRLDLSAGQRCLRCRLR